MKQFHLEQSSRGTDFYKVIYIQTGLERPMVREFSGSPESVLQLMKDLMSEEP